MSVEKRISKWIESYEQNGYLNGSILIANKENIILNKGFGLANREHMVPNNPTTKFRIGSLTKSFTAFGIFQLHDLQKLNIHDCIDKYLPDYPNSNRITIYHCLTNTSGIPNYTSFPEFWSTTMRLPLTLNEMIDSFKNLSLNFDPGSRFEYSNSGYALLTAIIENVTGMTYSDYIREKICHPLEMYHTGCDDGSKVIPNLASGYSFWESPIHTAYADLTFPLGAYGLYSTTEDLFLWVKALQKSKLLNEELRDKMFTPNLSSYACGWMVSEMMDKECIHHFGDISGFSSNLLAFVEEKVTIIFLSNLSITPVAHLTKEMAKLLFEKEVKYPLPAASIKIISKKDFAGKYFIENESDKILQISLDNDALYLTVPKMYEVLYKIKLIPVNQETDKTTYKTETINEQLVFHRSNSGEIEYVVYTDFHGIISKAYKMTR